MLSSFLLGWENYFSETKYTQSFEYGSYSPQKQLPAATSGGNLYVFCCFFDKIQSTTNGGAIKGSGAKKLMVESSSFSNCLTTESKGGSIFYSNEADGNCVLSKTCSYKSQCLSDTSVIKDGFFSHICVKDSLDNINVADYVSASESSYTITNTQRTMFIGRGNATISSINITDNKLEDDTIFICWRCNKSVISHSSFMNNTADLNNCMEFDYNTVNDIKESNIVGNVAKDYVVYSYKAKYRFSNCCFLFNTAKNGLGGTKIPNDGVLSACVHDMPLGDAIEENAPQSSFVNVLQFGLCSFGPIKNTKNIITCIVKNHNIHDYNSYRRFLMLLNR